jgi:hypothetical protein
MDYAELTFYVDVAILLSTGPFAYLTWASGTLSMLWEQARRRHWTNRPDKTESGKAHEEWKERFG